MRDDSPHQSSHKSNPGGREYSYGWKESLAKESVHPEMHSVHQEAAKYTVVHKVHTIPYHGWSLTCQDGSKDSMSFVTPWILYRWAGIPFGHMNAQVAFQCYMEECQDGL